MNAPRVEQYYYSMYVGLCCKYVPKRQHRWLWVPCSDNNTVFTLRCRWQATVDSTPQISFRPL